MGYVTTKRSKTRAVAPVRSTVMATQLTLIDMPNQAEGAIDTDPGSTSEMPTRRAARTPGQVVPCGWCGAPALVPSRGRPPKWCSAACRHRAWEQRRAAESGLAVEIVERVVEKIVVEKIVVEKVTQTVEVPVPHRPQTAAEFAEVLSDLAIRLDTGRIYDRDLRTIEVAAVSLLDALRRRIVSRR